MSPFESFNYIWLLDSIILQRIADSYIILTDTLSWTDSQFLCQNIGSNLASIHSGIDFNHTIELCDSQSNGCWIGLNDISSEGEWQWTDNSITDFGFINNSFTKPTTGIYPWSNLSTYPPQPNNLFGDQHCIDLTKQRNYLWNDADCDALKHPICNDPINTTKPNNIIISTVYEYNTSFTFDSLMTGPILYVFIICVVLIIIACIVCIISTVFFVITKPPKSIEEQHKIQPDFNRVPQVSSEMVLMTDEEEKKSHIDCKDDESDSDNDVYSPPVSKQRSTMTDNLFETIKGSRSKKSVVSRVSSEKVDYLVLEQWLVNNVRLPQYYDNFVKNGYVSMDFITVIKNQEDLEEIGIVLKAHQLKILTEIERVKRKTVLEKIKDDIDEGKGNDHGKSYKSDNNVTNGITKLGMENYDSVSTADDYQKKIMENIEKGVDDVMTRNDEMKENGDGVELESTRKESMYGLKDEDKTVRT